MKTARRKKKKSILFTLFLLVAALCLLTLVWQGGVRLWGARTNRQVRELFYGDAQSTSAQPTSAQTEPAQTQLPLVTPVPSDAPAAAPTPEPTEQPQDDTVYAANPLLELAAEPKTPVISGEYAAMPQPREKYLSLLERNADTVGWLQVPDIIDLAVLQRDNAYYLTHDFFGRISAEGAAFLDEGASILPEDQHLIIHGHNMRSGNIFGELDLFRNLAYLKQRPVAAFNTLYEDHYYVPIAVFDISANKDHEKYMDLQQFDFETQEEFMAFVNDARFRSFFDIPIDVQPGDKLLSLVTCSYYDDNGRLVYMLRAVRPDENPKEIAKLVQNAVRK